MIISLRTALVLGCFALSWLSIIAVDLWNGGLNLQRPHYASFSLLFPKDLQPQRRASSGRRCVFLPFVWLTGCDDAVCKMLFFFKREKHLAASHFLCSIFCVDVRQKQSTFLLFDVFPPFITLNVAALLLWKMHGYQRLEKSSTTLQWNWEGWLLQSAAIMGWCFRSGWVFFQVNCVVHSSCHYASVRTCSTKKQSG